MYNNKKVVKQYKEENESNRLIRDLKGHNWLLRKLNGQIKLRVKIDKGRLSKKLVYIRNKGRKYSIPVSIPLRRLGFLSNKNRIINMDKEKVESEALKQECYEVKTPVFKIPTTAITPRVRRPVEETSNTYQQSPTDYARALTIDIPPSPPPFPSNQPRSHIPLHDLQALLRHSRATNSINDGDHNTLIKLDAVSGQLDVSVNQGREDLSRLRPVRRFSLDVSSASKSSETEQKNKICQTDDMFAHNYDDKNLIAFLEAHGLNKDRMMSLLAIQNITIKNIGELVNDDKVMNHQKPKHEMPESDYCFSRDNPPDERDIKKSANSLENSLPSFMVNILSHLTKIEHVLCDLRDQRTEPKVSPQKSVDTQTAESTQSVVVLHSCKRQRVLPPSTTSCLKKEPQRHIEVLNEHHAHPANSSNDMLSLPLRYYNTPSVCPRDPRMGSVHLMQPGYLRYGQSSRMDNFDNALPSSRAAGISETNPGKHYYNMAVSSSPTQQYMEWLSRQQGGPIEQSREQQLGKGRSQWDAHPNMPPPRL